MNKTENGGYTPIKKLLPLIVIVCFALLMVGLALSYDEELKKQGNVIRTGVILSIAFGNFFLIGLSARWAKQSRD